jgi:hypothetical protein
LNKELVHLLRVHLRSLLSLKGQQERRLPTAQIHSTLPIPVSRQFRFSPIFE